MTFSFSSALLPLPPRLITCLVGVVGTRGSSVSNNELRSVSRSYSNISCSRRYRFQQFQNSVQGSCASLSTLCNKSVTHPWTQNNRNKAGLDIDSLTRSISTSMVLWAEPLKKKKKIDPMIIKAREERKKRRLEKLIRRQEKHARQLKPLDECVIPNQIQDEPEARLRKNINISPEVLDSRWLLEKQWCRYKFQQHSREIRLFERLLKSQEVALAELRSESEELWLAAIQMDESLIPYKAKGPVDTPPIENYQSPDGDYIDISRNWNK